MSTTLLDLPQIEAAAAEVLRYLGYPAGAAPNARIAARVHEALEETSGHLHPKACYALYPVVERTRTRLTLPGGVRFTGPIGDFLGSADRVAVFLATAGPGIVALAEERGRRRDTLGALVYNALGSALADAATEALAARLRADLAPGEDISLPFSPGYCGISLAQQRTLFALVDAAAAGVELLPTLIMKPVKTVSGLLGIGPATAIAARLNPCDLCPRTDCAMRR